MSKDVVDKSKRRFLTAITSAVGGLGAAFAAVPFIASWWPSARAQAAGAPVECDISSLEPGEMKTVAWRGKPVWVIRRNKEMIDALQSTSVSERLRDPDSIAEQQPEYAQNPHRSSNPEYLVLIGICTHLGCSPKYHPEIGDINANWPGGFFCPCHGSSFDLAGRVFKSVPAPLNMEVPPYHFINEKTILIGEHGNRALQV